MSSMSHQKRVSCITVVQQTDEWLFNEHFLQNSLQSGRDSSYILEAIFDILLKHQRTINYK